jgi:hypothetical protein
MSLKMCNYKNSVVILGLAFRWIRSLSVIISYDYSLLDFRYNYSLFVGYVTDNRQHIRDESAHARRRNCCVLLIVGAD